MRKILIHCNYICTTGVINIPTTNLASLGPAALQVQVAQCGQKLEGKLPEMNSQMMSLNLTQKGTCLDFKSSDL